MRLLEARSVPSGPLSVVVAVAVVAATLAVGVLVRFLALQQAWLLVAEFLVALLGAAFIYRWRWGVFAILLYLPVQGMIANLFYPDTAAILLNDTLIGATYLGFIAAVNRGEQRWFVPRSFVLAFLVLAALCVIQTFNPLLHNRLIALVGFRVLLFYIPLFILGLSLAQQTPLLLDRLVWMVLITSLPVCLFGIWEWSVGAKVVSGFGPAFARTIWIVGPEADAALIFRPASTFAFIGQFSGYLLFVTLLSFAALHATRRLASLGLLGLVFGAALIGVILSGGRTIWIELPVMAVAVYLVRGRLNRLPPAVPLVAIGLVIAIAIGLPILHNRLPVMFRSDTILAHLRGFNPFHPEFFTWQGLIGHGTGSALGAIRYVNGGAVPIQFEGSWYILLYMFGVMGLLAYLFLYGVVLRLAWLGLRMLTGDRRWIGAAVFCYVLVTALLEGAINYPPTNVFFWLFAGLLAGQALAHRNSKAPPDPAHPATSPASGEVALSHAH